MLKPMLQSSNLALTSSFLKLYKHGGGAGGADRCWRCRPMLAVPTDAGGADRCCQPVPSGAGGAGDIGGAD